jgi:hypothetical protein
MQDSLTIDGVRYRKLDKKSKTDEKIYQEIEKELAEQSAEKEKENERKFANIVKTLNAERNSYHLTRIVLVRYLAFIYLVAFVVAYNQNIHLLGRNGLLPVNKFMDNYYSKSRITIPKNADFLTDLKAKFSLFFKLPTLFWFFNWRTDIDLLLSGAALAGMTLSGLVLVQGGANSIIMLSLWLLYHSIINVGQTWYSFGWESQVVESGFIVLFLVPFFSIKQINAKSPPSFIVICIYRWLISRIMIGAVCEYK